MRPSVYLAGPLDGVTVANATLWRDLVASLLERAGIAALDPLRGQKPRAAGAVLTSSKDTDCKTTDNAILHRDFHDCTRSNAVLAHLAKATKPSLGTAMEVGWAWQAQIPLIITGPGVYHDHPMIRAAASYVCEDLEQAVDVVIDLLGPFAT